jgi:hypothetical protein
MNRSRRVRSPWVIVSLVTALLSGACKSEHGEGPNADTAEPVGSASADEHGAHGKHQLPAAAFDACQGKNAGDACTAQFGARQLTAQCAAAPDGRLACIPHRGEHKKPEGS